MRYGIFSQAEGEFDFTLLKRDEKEKVERWRKIQGGLQSLAKRKDNMFLFFVCLLLLLFCFCLFCLLLLLLFWGEGINWGQNSRRYEIFSQTQGQSGHDFSVEKKKSWGKTQRGIQSLAKEGSLTLISCRKKSKLE